MNSEFTMDEDGSIAEYFKDFNILNTGESTTVLQVKEVIDPEYPDSDIVETVNAMLEWFDTMSPTSTVESSGSLNGRIDKNGGNSDPDSEAKETIDAILDRLSQKSTEELIRSQYPDDTINKGTDLEEDLFLMNIFRKLSKLKRKRNDNLIDHHDEMDYDIADTEDIIMESDSDEYTETNYTAYENSSPDNQGKGLEKFSQPNLASASSCHLTSFHEGETEADICHYFRRNELQNGPLTFTNPNLTLANSTEDTQTNNFKELYHFVSSESLVANKCPTNLDLLQADESTSRNMYKSTTNVREWNMENDSDGSVESEDMLLELTRSPRIPISLLHTSIENTAFLQSRNDSHSVTKLKIQDYDDVQSLSSETTKKGTMNGGRKLIKDSKRVFKRIGNFRRKIGKPRKISNCKSFLQFCKLMKEIVLKIFPDGGNCNRNRVKFRTSALWALNQSYYAVLYGLVEHAYLSLNREAGTLNTLYKS